MRSSTAVKRNLSETVSHEPFATTAVGEQAEVADAHKALGEDVEQEATDELANGQPHDFASRRAALPVILPAKTDMVVVEIEDRGVGVEEEELLGIGRALHDEAQRGVDRCPGRRPVGRGPLLQEEQAQVA